VRDRTRNLVMAYDARRLDVADFRQIRARIHALAPDIEVFLVSSRSPAMSDVRKAAERPTLVFSPTDLRQFRPMRGKVYCGRAMKKSEQMARLAAVGVSVPRTAVFGPDTVLDPAEWGDHILLKPTAGSESHGKGVQLMRTERVRHIAPEDYPPGHPGRKGPMLLQQFIDTGSRPLHYRVSTLFGEVLYAYASRLIGERPPLDAPDEVLESACVATNGGERDRFFYEDEEIFALARRVYEAVPEIPLHGCDILRDVRDGRLYVIEFNPRGNTWHFSSPRGGGAESREALGGRAALVGQLGAFDVAARVLIDRTRCEAE